MPNQLLRAIIPEPVALSTGHAARLDPGEAALLRNVDLTGLPGIVRRGRGCCRVLEVAGSSTRIVAAAVVRRRDCRKMLLDYSSAGTLRATVSQGTPVVGAPCIGPVPVMMNIPDDIGDGRTQFTYVYATDNRDRVIFSGATPGRRYSVWAVGRWRQDPADNFDCGPEGCTTGIGTIPNPAGGLFAGQLFGAFMVKEPGGTWTKTGKYGTVTATAAGNIIGAFADWDGLYGDNLGYMSVFVLELR